MNRSDGISITYAPNRVEYAPDRVEVGRVFRIALDVPEDQVPVELAGPESVQALDRTAPERAGETLFYCRAVRVERGGRGSASAPRSAVRLVAESATGTVSNREIQKYRNTIKMRRGV